MNNWVTKAKLARLGKCSHQLITKYTKPGGKFAVAVGPAGKVDTHHKVVVDWLKTRENVVSPQDITTKHFGEMTINQVTESYGDVDKLEGFIKVRKLIAETEHKQVMMAEKRGTLIDRDLVAKACFGFLEAATQKLLEMPKGIVIELQAIFETQSPSMKEDSQQYLTDEISKILEGVKKEVSDKLQLDDAEMKKSQEVNAEFAFPELEKEDDE